MPRQARHAPGEIIYHVLNRAAGRRELFGKRDDYAAFIRLFHDAVEDSGMRVCGFCLMPNHWHLLLWPRVDGELARFMQKLTITHVRRWLEHRHRVGYGSVYQGRYKSFPVQDDAHFSTVARYVERNPVRAHLAPRAQQWPWSSAGQQAAEDCPLVPIAPWPTPRRKDWIEWVNQPQTPAEEAALRYCLQKGRPYGSELWTGKTEARLSMPPPGRLGRPRKGHGKA